ncbi:hypothetical protein V3W47_01460 [Deinococcus sp. YIM 134068]|uniref:hypothetical protein n=1 Tax=Deinococcus lichenicola TaxID=3118910 RepID=UPI002F95481F
MTNEQRANDITDAYNQNVSMERRVEIIRNGHKVALEILANSANIDPIIFDLLIKTGAENVILKLAKRDDLEEHQIVQISELGSYRALSRLCKNSDIPPNVIRSILRDNPNLVIDLIDQADFDVTLIGEVIEKLNQYTLRKVLNDKRISEKVMGEYISRIVDLSISNEVEKFLIEECILTYEDLRLLYSKSQDHRSWIRSSEKVGGEVKRKLLNEYVPQMRLGEFNDGFMYYLCEHEPALEALIHSEYIDIMAVLEAVIDSKYSRDINDILTCVVLLEYSTTDRYYTYFNNAEDKYMVSPMTLENKLKSDELRACLSSELANWLGSIEGSFDMVTFRNEEIAAFLDSELTCEKVFMIGMHFNRFLEKVCGSYFCPFYLLDTAIRLADEEVASIANDTKQRKLDITTSEVINSLNTSRREEIDFWNDYYQRLDLEERDIGVYEKHKREAGY